MTDLPKFEKPQFKIIRRRGMPNEATLPDGTKVYRSMTDSGVEAIFLRELGGFVRVASYDDHFIYEVPDKLAKKYAWAQGAAFRCTCGSFAVWAGLSAYGHDASPQGKLLVCYLHANTGQHATGGNRWI